MQHLDYEFVQKLANRISRGRFLKEYHRSLSTCKVSYNNQRHQDFLNLAYCGILLPSTMISRIRRSDIWSIISKDMYPQNFLLAAASRLKHKAVISCFESEFTLCDYTAITPNIMSLNLECSKRDGAVNILLLWSKLIIRYYPCRGF